VDECRHPLSARNYGKLRVIAAAPPHNQVMRSEWAVNAAMNPIPSLSSCRYLSSGFPTHKSISTIAPIGSAATPIVVRAG
jgi:hypothetical protein